MVRLRKKVQKRKSTPIYNIGTASRLTGIPIWTLRWIERHGLISPTRTGGNQRLFSDTDMDMLNEIRKLMEEHVNLPGIRIILRMRYRVTSIKLTQGGINDGEGIDAHQE
ncbi:MAG: MerR family transcriptional regulator [Elusimicrobia bacterium]|nr:MerR family transcriptional regulator [Elusimicrobiota bacterium]